MTDHPHWKAASMHFNKLPRRKLRQARAFALGCILLVMCAESMLGYVLGSYFTNTSSFNQAYTSGNTSLAKMHRSAKNQVASLLDFGRIPSGKHASQGPFTLSFNLFIDQYKTQLPCCMVFEIEVYSGFHYNPLYDFTHFKDILHPPQWT